ISDSAERDGVEGRAWVKFSGKGSPLERDEELVGDATRGESVEGIRALRLLGINERVDRRALRADLVVVGHDQPHAGWPPSGSLHRVRSTIAGNDEPGTARLDLDERIQ